MFDFSSFSVSSVVSVPILSVSEIQANLNIAQVFPEGINSMVQTGTAKFAIPFNYEDAIYWVEVSFVAKKNDFDAAKAEHDYQVKVQKGLEREQERCAKHETKANTKT